MTVSLGAFTQAEAQQESGGNYTAVSPDGALGKYQIMPGNLSAWGQQFLGRPETPAQFLASPADQEAIARGKLAQLYTEYGPAGAAAAWYSGNPALANSTAPQNNGPSVASYVQQVLARAAAIDSGSPGGAAAGGTLGTTTATTAASITTAAFWNPFSWSWGRIGIGILGGTLILLGLYLTFSNVVPPAVKQAAETGLAVAAV